MKEKHYIVYKITCKINNKVYIGQTYETLKERFKRHMNFAFTDSRSQNIKFARAIRKYGKDNFYIELVEEVFSQEELDDREYYWIQYYDSVNNGYNSKNSKGKCGGDTLSNHWNKKEISRKISEAMSGDKNPMKRFGHKVKGENNGMYGKYGSLNPWSQKCVGVNSVTGEIKITDSQREMAKYVGLKSDSGVSSRIKGRCTSEYKGWMFYNYEEYLKSSETIESVDNEKDIIE